jgi:hypothetical protein
MGDFVFKQPGELNTAAAWSSQPDALLASSSSSSQHMCARWPQAGGANIQQLCVCMHACGCMHVGACMCVDACVQDSRRSSWPLLAQKIQAGEWIAFSQLLQESPFDAVRQVCWNKG